jgi:hypothetical protein
MNVHKNARLTPRRRQELVMRLAVGEPLKRVCGLFKGRLEDGRAIYEQLVGIIALPKRDAACASARIPETFHLPE